MKKGRIVTAIIIMVLVMTLFSGCSNTGSTASSNSTNSPTGGVSGTASAEKVLYVGLANDITSLDYAYNYTISNFQVVDSINDFLLVFDENGNMQPSLCTSWEAVDPVTYVYQIRNDVLFSDGTPMTMEDVVYSMERIKDPATASDMNWAYANVDTIEATGEWELTVTLTKPDSTWQYIPATPGCQITSKAYCESAGDNFGNADGLTLGTGAYKVDSWSTGSEVILSKNENYWGEEPYYDKVVYMVINDESSMALAMTSGQIDFCIPSSTDLASTYSSSTNCDIYSVEGLGTTLLSFNCSAGQCADANLRKAISCCVDTVTLVQSQLGEYGVAPTACPFGEGLYVLNPEEWKNRISALDNYDYNLEKAKEYLEASSYDGSMLVFKIIEGNTVYANYAQIIQASCAEIGINISIEKVTTSEYYANAYGSDLDADGHRKYDMMINRWVPDYIDPAGDLVPFYDSANAGAGANYAAYCNDKVDALLDAQAVSIDNEERSELMLQAIEIANADAPYKALYYYNTFYCKTDDIDYELAGFWLYSIFMKDFKPAE